jgi:hypothetical protein
MTTDREAEDTPCLPPTSPAQITAADPPNKQAAHGDNVSPRVAEPVFIVGEGLVTPILENAHSFQLPEIEASINSNVSLPLNWAWNGKDWTITERPGSAHTRQFYLRVKDTKGKWRYASAPSLSVAEYNRRFTSKKSAADKLHKVTRKRDYEKFTKFCFETWRAQALRTDYTLDRSSASDS